MLLTHPYLEQLVLIGPDSRTIEEIPDDRRRRLLCVSLQELEQNKARQALKKIPEHIPLYISIDKDVLGKNYARTNWSQGGMSDNKNQSAIMMSWTILLSRRLLSLLFFNIVKSRYFRNYIPV